MIANDSSDVRPTVGSRPSGIQSTPYSASSSRMACWCRGSESASTPSMSKMTASIAARGSSVPLTGQRVLEQRHLGNRFGNLPVQRHADRLRHRHHRALEALVVVGGQGIGRPAVPNVPPRAVCYRKGLMARERHLDGLFKRLVQTIEASLTATDAARDAVQEILRRGADTGIFFAGAKSRGFSSELTAQDKEFLRALSIKPER